MIAVALAAAFGAYLAIGALTLAHDEADWIMRGFFRNANGEFCCGPSDCAPTIAKTVSQPAAGYLLPGGEFVPQGEAMPSVDGQFWRCKRADNSRRCFFAPPPNS